MSSNVYSSSYSGKKLFIVENFKVLHVGRIDCKIKTYLMHRKFPWKPQHIRWSYFECSLPSNQLSSLLFCSNIFNRCQKTCLPPKIISREKPCLQIFYFFYILHWKNSNNSRNNNIFLSSIQRIATHFITANMPFFNTNVLLLFLARCYQLISSFRFY